MPPPPYPTTTHTHQPPLHHGQCQRSCQQEVRPGTAAAAAGHQQPGLHMFRDLTALALLPAGQVDVRAAAADGERPRDPLFSSVAAASTHSCAAPQMQPVLGVSAFPAGDNIFEWVATIEGSKGTVRPPAPCKAAAQQQHTLAHITTHTGAPNSTHITQKLAQRHASSRRTHAAAARTRNAFSSTHSTHTAHLHGRC